MWSLYGLPERGDLPRLEFHRDNAVIDSNQIVGPAAQSVPHRNERWLLVDSAHVRISDLQRQKTRLRKSRAPEQPRQYRRDDRNEKQHRESVQQTRKVSQ